MFLLSKAQCCTFQVSGLCIWRLELKFLSLCIIGWNKFEWKLKLNNLTVTIITMDHFQFNTLLSSGYWDWFWSCNWTQVPTHANLEVAPCGRNLGRSINVDWPAGLNNTYSTNGVLGHISSQIDASLFCNIFINLCEKLTFTERSSRQFCRGIQFLTQVLVINQWRTDFSTETTRTETELGQFQWGSLLPGT